MRDREFSQVSVFGDGVFSGNPLAVVLDGAGLVDSERAAFARFTNLSETTFVEEPEDPAADYRVRILTPVEELPFAGHPTLGTASVVAAHRGLGGTIIQESPAGLVEVRVGKRPAFAAPSSRRRELTDEETEQLSTMLGLSPTRAKAGVLIDNGPAWWTLFLNDAADLQSLQPDLAALTAQRRKVAVCASDDAGGLVVRALTVGAAGVVEDPVTGSLNGGIAQWRADHGATNDYTARQSTSDGRGGEVGIAFGEDGKVWVSGEVTEVISGTVRL